MVIRLLAGSLMIAIALLAFALTTYYNLRASRGPRERQFVLRACLIVLLLMVSLLTLMYYLPSPYRYLVLLGYMVVLPLLLYRLATVHQLIRYLEEHQTGGSSGSG